MLVLILFFCSGASALVYEVLWSKYLAQMIGSTVQAQTVVLAVFMGGLALGNRLFGNRADRLRQPLSTYGYLELAIGLYAFFFSGMYRLADIIFVQVGTPIFEWSGLLLALKLLISFFLLIIPTILMGGTLPLLASWIQKHPSLDWSSRVSLFYGINSFGAVAGAALAGFVLVQSLGMVSSLQIVGLANVMVGAIAILLGKREVFLTDPKADSTKEQSAQVATKSWGWFGLLVGVTGGVSMGLEVLSSRTLALIVGGSLQAFALVLMGFIFGIGIGSIVISSSKLARRLGIRMIYVLLLGAAVLVGLNIILIEKWAIFYSHAKFGLAANSTGYLWQQTIIAAMALLVIGLPAAFLGATVPLAISLLETSGVGAAVYVGRLLTCNTLGAVCGTLLTGFFLMPVFGIRGALTVLTAVLLTAVALIAARRQHRSVLFGTATIAALLLIGISFTGAHWKRVLGAGIFRMRKTVLTSDVIKKISTAARLQFYKDGPDATVLVERGNDAGVEESYLKINGKTDASSYGDLSTQLLLAHLPMAARPEAKQVFVLGFGSGITAGALLGHPIERLTIAENCRPVLEAAKCFAEYNRGVLTNSRTQVRKEDARAVLKLSPQKYDVIISEPSNPWVVGVGSVFSKDFYDLAATRLSDGGVMAQWFHIYEMSDEIVFLVLRTFGTVFPNMEVWDTQNGDIVLLGSKKPWVSNPETFQTLFERPEPKADLLKIHMSSPLVLWGRQAASQRTASAIAGPGPIQTDEFPVLEYAAPKAFFVAEWAVRLFKYDERGANFPLASAEKQQALRTAPADAITAAARAIRFWNSSNPDLQKYYAYLAEGDATPLTGLHSPLEIIFRQPESYSETVKLPRTASPEWRKLTDIHNRILRNPSEVKEQLQQLEQVLEKLAAEKKTGLDFSAGNFAAMGARFAIQAEEIQTAQNLVKLGLGFEPENELLHFITRLLDRTLPTSTLESKSNSHQVSTNRLISQN